LPGLVQKCRIGSVCQTTPLKATWIFIWLSIKGVDGAENVTLSGKFLSKVYEGNFEKTAEWCSDFENYAKSKGLAVKKWYMWYTTCPVCAEKYGKNYVVIISEVE
jgi:hypothetical protein